MNSHDPLELNVTISTMHTNLNELRKLVFEFTYTNRGAKPLVLNMYRFQENSQVVKMGPVDKVEQIPLHAPHYLVQLRAAPRAEDVVRLAPGQRHSIRKEYPLYAAFPYGRSENGRWILFRMKDAGSYTAILRDVFQNDERMKPFLKSGEAYWEGTVDGPEVSFTLEEAPGDESGGGSCTGPWGGEPLVRDDLALMVGGSFSKDTLGEDYGRIRQRLLNSPSTYSLALRKYYIGGPLVEPEHLATMRFQDALRLLTEVAAPAACQLARDLIERQYAPALQTYDQTPNSLNETRNELFALSKLVDEDFRLLLETESLRDRDQVPAYVAAFRRLTTQADEYGEVFHPKSLCDLQSVSRLDFARFLTWGYARMEWDDKEEVTWLSAQQCVDVLETFLRSVSPKDQPLLNRQIDKLHRVQQALEIEMGEARAQTVRSGNYQG